MLFDVDLSTLDMFPILVHDTSELTQAKGFNAILIIALNVTPCTFQQTVNFLQLPFTLFEPLQFVLS